MPTKTDKPTGASLMPTTANLMSPDTRKSSPNAMGEEEFAPTATRGNPRSSLAFMRDKRPTKLATLFQSLPAAFVRAVRPRRDPETPEAVFTVQFFVGVTFPTLDPEQRRTLEFLLYTRMALEATIVARRKKLSARRRSQLERSAHEAEAAWMALAELGRQMITKISLTCEQRAFIEELLLAPAQAAASSRLARREFRSYHASTHQHQTEKSAQPGKKASEIYTS